MMPPESTHCAKCGALLGMSAICPYCLPNEMGEATGVDHQEALQPTWLSAVILFFPIWGIALFAWLDDSVGLSGIANVGIFLAIFSSLPIILSKSLSALAKIFLVFGYYWIAVPAAVITLLAVVGRA